MSLMGKNEPGSLAVGTAGLPPIADDLRTQHNRSRSPQVQSRISCRNRVAGISYPSTSANGQHYNSIGVCMTGSTAFDRPLNYPGLRCSKNASVVPECGPIAAA